MMNFTNTDSVNILNRGQNYFDLLQHVKLNLVWQVSGNFSLLLPTSDKVVYKIEKTFLWLFLRNFFETFRGTFL